MIDNGQNQRLEPIKNNSVESKDKNQQKLYKKNKSN